MNTNRRTLLLAIALLLAVAVVVGRQLLPDDWRPAMPSVASPGKNKIISATLAQTTNNDLMFDVTYFYNGAEQQHAFVTIEMLPPGLEPAPMPARAGQQRIGLSIVRKDSAAAFNMSGVAIVMRTVDRVLAETFVHGPFDWPAYDEYRLASNTPAEIQRLYELCVQSIDGAHSSRQVREGLERIIIADPRFVPAYAEMARLHMKTNWGPAGLAQAEQALLTALRYDPKHANTLVLIGYVHTHQKRYEEAEKDFAAAEAIGTPNIWLPTNRGDLYFRQGRSDKAVEAYKKAINAPESLATYERARHEAFLRLVEMLEKQKRWQEADAVYEKMVSRYANEPCIPAKYADYKLRQHGDFEGALKLGTDSMGRVCTQYGRSALSRAYLLKWATLLNGGTKPADAEEWFSRGQALVEEQATTIYELAKSRHTAIVLKHLAERGIDIDTPDSNGLSALANSITQRELSVAGTLIDMGADVSYRVNPDRFDLLMLAASIGDKDAVALLLKHGADTNARTQSGYNAERIARESGHDDIARMLSARNM